MPATLEVDGGEGEEGEGGLVAETTAAIGEGTETSTFETETETDIEMREAGSENGTGESREIAETSGCADHQLEEHDHRREIFVTGISPLG